MEQSFTRSMFKNRYYQAYLASLAVIGVVGAKAIWDLPGYEATPHQPQQTAKSNEAPKSGLSNQIVVPPAHRFLEDATCPSNKATDCVLVDKLELWSKTGFYTPELPQLEEPEPTQQHEEDPSMLNENDRETQPHGEPIHVMPPEDAPTNNSAIQVMVPPTGEDGKPVYQEKPMDVGCALPGPKAKHCSQSQKNGGKKTSTKTPKKDKNGWDFTKPFTDLFR